MTAKEKQAINRRKHYVANKEKAIQQMNEYYYANKKIILKRGRARYVEIKHEVMSKYSGGVPKCSQCGHEDIDVLQIDHINGGGREHRKKAGVAVRLYYWIRRNGYPDDLCVLCANCNIKKEISRRRKKAEAA